LKIPGLTLQSPSYDTDFSTFHELSQSLIEQVAPAAAALPAMSTPAMSNVVPMPAGSVKYAADLCPFVLAVAVL
jgi:hypothetical protein